jgi:cellulose synthase/poly-beta-1,6-N-acetylglucosamine synthase-like glycosyltransferase
VDANVTRLSIIVPTLDEARNIEELLAHLAPIRARGAEIIVADGGSSDGTPALATPAADKVLACPRGRAAQMNGRRQHAARRGRAHDELALARDRHLHR